MPTDVVKLTGSIARATMKPPKYTEDGGKIKQEEHIEIVLHVPMIPTLRPKLPEISLLMGDSVNIALAPPQTEFDI